MASRRLDFGSYGKEGATIQKESDTVKVTDPVCGMSIESEKAKASETYQGTTYYFCCARCQSAFKADAAKFAAQAGQSGAHGGRS